jgi:hypothetical protein
MQTSDNDSGQQHFVDWKPGILMHTHLGKCIKCGSPEGDTILYVRPEIGAASSLELRYDSAANRLCTACKEKYLPLTEGVRRELDSLTAKIWPTLRKRGCPCCEAGLTWHPVELMH